VEGAVAGCGAAGWLSIKPTFDEAFLALLTSPRKSRSKTGFKYFKAFCRSLKQALNLEVVLMIGTGNSFFFLHFWMFQS